MRLFTSYLTSFHGWNTDWAIPCYMIRISISCTLSFNTLSDAHSCLFRAVTGIIKAEEIKASRAAASLELRQSDLTPQRQNGVYVFEFRKKMDVIWKFRLFHINSDKGQRLLWCFGCVLQCFIHSNETGWLIDSWDLRIDIGS